MRYLLLTIVLLSSLRALANDRPSLDAFASEYWSAVISQDPTRIFSFYDPAVFNQLSPEEDAFMKAYWIEGYNQLVEQQGDSYEIESQTLPADADPFPGWRWAAKPEFQFQIQTFRNVPNGKEGIALLVDLAVFREGRCFIVRGVPPPEKLEVQMKKNKG